MCGIVGYTGKRQATPILLRGLSKLEYRGYDSAGVAVNGDGKINMVKAKGRLKNLVDMTNQGNDIKGVTGIGHTRWATHGEPNDINSHPHISYGKRFAVVHNGIIENYAELKEKLIKRGCTFLSETDTEVIANLIEYYYNGNMSETLTKTVNKLKGSYAIGVLSIDAPEIIYAARKDSPLVVGLSIGENFIASDMPALLEYTRNFILLEDNETAVITPNSIKIFDLNGEEIEKAPFRAEWDEQAAEKDGYAHFMIKEINEQPKAVRNTISPRIKDGKLSGESFGLSKDEINKIKNINITACGSAYHAGIVGKYFIENLCRIPVEVRLASEFRYCNPIVEKESLTVIVSQSGETADTLAALREAKRLGSKILSIVNVIGSSIARESDGVFYTYAGPEISVATTKGYTTQVTALFVLGIYMATAKGILSAAEGDNLLSQLNEIPDKISQVIASSTPTVQNLAAAYFGAGDAYYIGRGTDYAAAMEGALKLKEISYIHAEAYAAGELKHGTISLIEHNSLVVALATNPSLYPKIRSNIAEVRTRGAKVMLITFENNTGMESECDYFVPLPDCRPEFASILSAVVMQLFGYYTAAAKGLDIDKPRNLAKSVTVE